VKGKRGKDTEPTKVGMYVAKELCDMKLKEIAEQFGSWVVWHGD
jgi:chromosomal replication initiation ATPase DnaA